MLMKVFLHLMLIKLLMKMIHLLMLTWLIPLICGMVDLEMKTLAIWKKWMNVES